MPNCLDCGVEWDQPNGCDCYDDNGRVDDPVMDVDLAGGNTNDE